MIVKQKSTTCINFKSIRPTIPILLGTLIIIKPSLAADTSPKNIQPAKPLTKAQGQQDTLTEAPVLLAPLTVMGKPISSTSSGYTAYNASTATKHNTPLMETPLSITVLPKTIIQDQQAIQLSDVTKNVSGVFQGNNLGGVVDRFMIRGFNNNYVNYYDGYRLPQASGLSLANAERIEVIKGAAANLYGRVEPGGMINVVTKRPQNTPYYALEQQWGSYDLYRTTADATGAVTKSGTLLYRINLENLTQNSFRDYSNADRLFVAPSLTWKITERDQLDLDFMYADQNNRVDYGVPLNNLTHRPADIPITRYLSNPATNNSHSKLYNTSATFTHALSDEWKLSAKFNYLNRHLDMPQSVPLALNPQSGVLQNAYLRLVNPIDSYMGVVEMTGRFKTGLAKHKVLAGWDHYQLSSTQNNYSYGPLQQYFNPINIYRPSYPNSIGSISNLKPNDFYDATMQWNGLYAQDQITVFDNWHLLGGGRYDWISETAGHSNQSLALATAHSTNRQNGRFNPRVGLLYQPWQWLSLYSNYLQSLGNANVNMAVNGSILQPETAEQVEAGFKTTFFEDNLTSSIAFYRLTKQNMAVPITGTFFLENINKARSQGIEVDVAGRITDSLSLIGNYTYTDASVLQGKYAGNQLWNVPKNAGSLWAKYDVQQAALSGLSVGAGVYLQGQKAGDMANTYQLSGYGRVDAMIKYKISAANTTLQFNVENLLNKQYYAASLPNNMSAISPGVPLTFIGSVKVEF